MSICRVFGLDTERGLIYAGVSAGGDEGLVIIKVWECPDVGVDFSSKPARILVDEKVEKKALQQVIGQGLFQAQSRCGIDPDSITIIEQGTGSCVWTADSCPDDYQPGLSDHDFEVFFNDGVSTETKRCVINSLYDQVMNNQSDPKPVIEEQSGYTIYFDDINFLLHG